MNSEPEFPNLTVQHLAYLEAVTQSPTWAAAAGSLGVTQSALSQGLAEFERRLGVPLFEWQGRRRILRPQAAEVAAYASRVLAQTRDLARWAREVRDGRAGRLRIGMIDAAAVQHYPGALREFRRRHPEVELHLAVAASGELLEQLQRGALDLAVVVDNGRSMPTVTTTTLLDEPLTLYAPGSQRAGPPHRWGPWVTFPAGSHTRNIIDAALRAEGAPLEIAAESHQPEVLREMVRLGLGWAVLPVAQAEARPGALRRARREPLAHRSLVAARRSESPLDTAAASLLELLSEPHGSN